jgi:predicted nucleic acid-binding protein
LTATLVDASVILDIASEDDRWLDWSASMLTAAAERGPIVINPIIYAEVSTRFETIESLDDALPVELYTRVALPWEAGFLAAKAFREYRRRGGARTTTLPDFFIGAHAAIDGLTLLTRDVRRYLTYFPKLRIIAP